MSLQLQPVLLALGDDGGESFLVFADRYLVAVLVRLSASHQEDAGKWFLEAGFGRVDDPTQPIFTTLEDAQTWIRHRLARIPGHAQR